MRYHVEQASGAHLRIIDVAIVVVEDILAPVGRAGGLIVFAGVVDLVFVIPVDIAVAAVGLGDGGDGDDHVVADLLDQRSIFGGQAIGQFHQHFGRAGFGAVEAAHEVIDGLGFAR